MDGFLVTDLTPDPVASLDHLCAVFNDAAASGVVLLMDPAATTLRLVLLRAAAIPIVDVIVKGQADGRDIEVTICELMSRVDLARLGEEVVSLLRLPDAARIMVEPLCGVQPATTVRGLQARLGWGRKKVESAVLEYGFARPFDFVRTVRVAAACALLKRGYAVKSVAERLSYRSTDTLAEHSRSLVGAPPSVARNLDEEQLRRRLASR